MQTKNKIRLVLGVNLVLGLILCFTSSAEACRRCGRHGNQCRFVHHVVKKVVAPVYVPPQVVIHNSVYPSPLAAQGATDYGVSLQSYSQGSLIDTAASVNSLLRLSQSVVDGGNQLALRVTDTVRETSAASIQLQQSNQGQVAEVAKLMQLAEIARQTKSEPIRQEIRIEANGQVKVGDQDHPLPHEFGAGVTASCIKCHSGAAPSKGLLLDSAEALNALAPEKRIEAQKRVMNGTMPPPGKSEPLTLEQKMAVLVDLIGQ